jgi:hypothetical protein
MAGNTIRPGQHLAEQLKELGMSADTRKGIEEFETELWAAADNLCANSILTSSDYVMPMPGMIFLRRLMSGEISV